MQKGQPISFLLRGRIIDGVVSESVNVTPDMIDIRLNGEDFDRRAKASEVTAVRRARNNRGSRRGRKEGRGSSRRNPDKREGLPRAVPSQADLAEDLADQEEAREMAYVAEQRLAAEKSGRKTVTTAPIRHTYTPDFVGFVKQQKHAVAVRPDPPRKSEDGKGLCGNPIDGRAYYLMLDKHMVGVPRTLTYRQYLSWQDETLSRLNDHPDQPWNFAGSAESLNDRYRRHFAARMRISISDVDLSDLTAIESARRAIWLTKGLLSQGAYLRELRAKGRLTEHIVPTPRLGKKLAKKGKVLAVDLWVAAEERKVKPLPKPVQDSEGNVVELDLALVEGFTFAKNPRVNRPWSEITEDGQNPVGVESLGGKTWFSVYEQSSVQESLLAKLNPYALQRFRTKKEGTLLTQVTAFLSAKSEVASNERVRQSARMLILSGGARVGGKRRVRVDPQLIVEDGVNMWVGLESKAKSPFFSFVYQGTGVPGQGRIPRCEPSHFAVGGRTVRSKDAETQYAAKRAINDVRYALGGLASFLSKFSDKDKDSYYLKPQYQNEKINKVIQAFVKEADWIDEYKGKRSAQRLAKALGFPAQGAGGEIEALRRMAETANRLCPRTKDGGREPCFDARAWSRLIEALPEKSYYRQAHRFLERGIAVPDWDLPSSAKNADSKDSWTTLNALNAAFKREVEKELKRELLGVPVGVKDKLDEVKRRYRFAIAELRRGGGNEVAKKRLEADYHKETSKIRQAFEGPVRGKIGPLFGKLALLAGLYYQANGFALVGPINSGKMDDKAVLPAMLDKIKSVSYMEHVDFVSDGERLGTQLSRYLGLPELKGKSPWKSLAVKKLVRKKQVRLTRNRREATDADLEQPLRKGVYVYVDRKDEGLAPKRTPYAVYKTYNPALFRLARQNFGGTVYSRPDVWEALDGVGVYGTAMRLTQWAVLQVGLDEMQKITASVAAKVKTELSLLSGTEAQDLIWPLGLSRVEAKEQWADFEARPAGFVQSLRKGVPKWAIKTMAVRKERDIPQPDFHPKDTDWMGQGGLDPVGATAKVFRYTDIGLALIESARKTENLK